MHHGISTPVSYISDACLTDVFGEQRRLSFYTGDVLKRFRYRAFDEDYLAGAIPSASSDSPGSIAAKDRMGMWALYSYGPDKRVGIPTNFADGANETDWMWQIYDPTNGTTSGGDVIRCQNGKPNYSGYNIEYYH